MIKKTSTSFRSFWFAILVFLLTNTVDGKGHTITIKVIDFGTSFKLASVFPNANSSFISGMLQKQYTFTFSQFGFEEYELPVVTNSSTNISLYKRFITIKDIATTATHLSSQHSI